MVMSRSVPRIFFKPRLPDEPRALLQFVAGSFDLPEKTTQEPFVAGAPGGTPMDSGRIR